VVSVAAIDATGAQAWFSNSGQGLTLAAPGVGIVSAYTANKLVIGSGTSQAAAITSGVAAYLAGRGYQTTNISTVLARSARPTGAAQTAVGAGILRIP
jgi:subtilisin family serine protease